MKKTKILAMAAALSISMAVITGCGKAADADGFTNEAVEALVENEPVVSSEPVGTAKPDATAEPNVAAGTAATAKPTATEAPTATAKPTATSAPTATARPVATSAPEATAKPTAATASTATARPAATAAPEATAKPAATSAPEATAKPAATATPEATAKPTATAAPTATPAPTAAPTSTPGQSASSSCKHYYVIQEVTEIFDNCTGRSRCVDVCNKCGAEGEVHSDTGIVEVHAFYEPIIASWPTCSSPGEQYHICQRCGKEGDHLQMPIIPDNHDYVRTGESVMADSYCGGNVLLLVTYTCSQCGNTKNETEDGPRGDHLDNDGNGLCDFCGEVCGEPVQQPDPVPESISGQ